ncbi:MAG: BTAD domain-containing putative transcriptional regulator [Acidimicrobiales bacterium]
MTAAQRTSVRFRVLGVLEVVAAGRPVELRAPKLRALVAMLALHPKQVVSADRLMEALWGEEAPPSASATLQTYISKLRSALGPELIQTRSPGYLLSVDPQEVDAGRFEALVAEGTALLRRGDADTASARLGEALSLWRGDALTDFTFETFAQPERARLEEARLSALEEWVESELARGRQSELVGRLRALVDDHPLRERLWGQLIVALYRCGRQAEALRTYAELRDRLRDDLGIEPSVALQRLESAVLLQEPELEGPRSPGEPVTDGAVPRAALRSMPLPTRLDLSGAYSFVGREAELEHLDVHRRAAASAGPKLALIAGEPGVGQTRLAAEVAGRAHRDGAIVLYGRCDEELVTPYQPFAEAAAQMARQFTREELTAVIGNMGGELIRLAPQLDDSTPPAAAVELDPETARHRMYDALAGALGQLCCLAPVVLVLDDLHWATRPTLGLLRFLLTCDQPMALLVVATYRDTQHPVGEKADELMWDLLSIPGATRVTLTGLDEAAVRELIVEASGGSLGDRAAALAGSIRGDTGGNPFFVGELVRHLIESGSQAQRPFLPEGVVGVVRRRLSRLSETSVGLLRTAAVVGTEYDVAVVQGASGMDVDRVVSGLDEGVAAGLVVDMTGPSLRQRFAHGLVRTALYEDLSRARRALLHRQAGEAVELVFAGRLADHLPALAYHFSQAASAGAAGKAVSYTMQAGQRALGQLAYDEAVTYYEEALRLVEQGTESDRAQRFEIRFALAEARDRAGDTPGSKDAACRAAEDARLLASPARLARVALLYDRMGVVGHPDPTAVRLCQEALEALGDDHPALRARLLAKVAYHRSVSEGQAEAAEAMAEEALRLARHAADTDALELALSVRALTLVGTEHVSHRLLLGEEMLELADRSGNQRAQARALRIRAPARLELGGVAGFDEDVSRLEQLADAVRHWAYQSDAAQWRTLKALLDGRFEDVEPGVERMVSHAGRDPNFLGAAIGQRFFLRREQGRFDEACSVIAPAADHDRGLAVFRSLRAMAQAEMGQLEEARRHLDGLATEGFSSVPRDLTWMGSMSSLAEVCFRLEDAARAAVLHSRLRPHSGHLALVAFGICAGAVDRYLGMLAATQGDFAAAEGHFEASMLLEASSPPLCARTRTAYARMLLQRGWDGDRDRASEHLDAAGTAADTLGMAGLVSEIRGLSMRNLAT